MPWSSCHRTLISKRRRPPDPADCQYEKLLGSRRLKILQSSAPASRPRAFTSFVEIAVLRFLLFEFAKAFQDRRAPWYQRGLIRKPLGKIGVILLHDVEHRFLGEIAMVLRK